MIKIFQTNNSYDKSELQINTFFIIVNSLKEKNLKHYIQEMGATTERSLLFT